MISLDAPRSEGVSAALTAPAQRAAARAVVASEEHRDVVLIASCARPWGRAATAVMTIEAPWSLPRMPKIDDASRLTLRENTDRLFSGSSWYVAIRCLQSKSVLLSASMKHKVPPPSLFVRAMMKQFSHPIEGSGTRSAATPES